MDRFPDLGNLSALDRVRAFGPPLLIAHFCRSSPTTRHTLPACPRPNRTESHWWRSERGDCASEPAQPLEAPLAPKIPASKYRRSSDLLPPSVAARESGLRCGAT